MKESSRKGKGWRDGSAVHSTGRGPGFSSLHPHGGSQLSSTRNVTCLSCVTATPLLLLKMEKMLVGCLLMLGQFFLLPAGARDRPQARLPSRGRHVRTHPQTALLGEWGAPAAAGSGVGRGRPWTRGPGFGGLLPLGPLLTVLGTGGIPRVIGTSGLRMRIIQVFKLESQ